MPMEPALKALLVQTIRLAPYTGQDAYGKPTYGPAVEVPARIERHFITAATTTGAQLLDESVVFLDGTVPIDERSQLTLPDGTIAPLEGLKPVLDMAGNIHHFEVYL